MRRPLKLALAVAAIFVFLAVSAGLARVLSASASERSAIAELVAAEARGAPGPVAARIEDCRRSPACRALQRANVRRVRRPGVVKVLRLDPSTRISLGGVRGVTRVAWGVPGRGLPVVQCVGVRRTGDVVSGFGVELTRLSAPIGAEADCQV